MTIQIERTYATRYTYAILTRTYAQYAQASLPYAYGTRYTQGEEHHRVNGHDTIAILWV